MARHRNLPAHIAFAILMILEYPAKGQVFVHTFLDREPKQSDITTITARKEAEEKANPDAVDALKNLKEAKAAKDKGAPVTPPPPGKEDKAPPVAPASPAKEEDKALTQARVSAWQGLSDLAQKQRTHRMSDRSGMVLVNDKWVDIHDLLKDLGTMTADEEAAVCKVVGPALANHRFPVRWSSERSSCFWNQQGLDWAQGAQIACSGNAGTASVEVASDVFWGLRVRVQSSVAGTTDSTDKDVVAKAALKQLSTAGGNIAFGATYPWYAIDSGSGHVQGLFTSYIRVAGSVSALGGDNSTTETIQSKDANGNVELSALDAMVRIQSFKKTISLVLTGRVSFVNGTHAFNDQVMNTGHRGFMYNQLGIGLQFQDVSVVASRANYSHNLPGGGMTYTVIFSK